MNSKSARGVSSTIPFAACAIIISCLLGFTVSSAAPPAQSGASTRVPARQKGFDTPTQAADALIQAARNLDVTALREIFGPDGEDFVPAADPVQDKNQVAAFVARADEKTLVTIDPKNSARAILTVGNEAWPFPVPLVKRQGRWYFDSKAGRDEILYERIGANELDALTVCRGFVEAQEEYASEIHDDSGINQYAQRAISSDGKHDGLAWQNPDGSWAGPVGETVAKAIGEGYRTRGEPFHGYYFKFLKGQGPAAPHGELDYVINGVMIGGFALVAWPSDYGITGVKTFVVSYSGIVYQKDFGPDTARIAATMERYNPDKTWQRTDDNW
ncbi:MAG: DUF2950 domain-containing protein [Candidatus Sulfotelmatobacter sp.]